MARYPRLKYALDSIHVVALSTSLERGHHRLSLLTDEVWGVWEWEGQSPQFTLLALILSPLPSHLPLFPYLTAKKANRTLLSVEKGTVHSRRDPSEFDSRAVREAELRFITGIRCDQC